MPAAEPAVAAAPASRRRPWWIWATPFALMTGILCGVMANVLGSPMYERADQGANSILIEQARRFSLLTGNYSRTHINHPGPAFLYVQAAGEQVFWAATRIVPTALNGQLIAVYLLNAAFAACVVAIAYGWTQRLSGAVAALAVVFAFACIHPPAFGSDWMPYVYVPAYFAFVVAVASVAAGRLQDAWIMTVAGWFLIEGHVCFLLFVPVLFLAAVIGLALPRRRRLGAALRALLTRHRRAWIPAVAISAVFVLPMVVNVIMHGTGEWAKYVSLSGSHAGGLTPTVAQVRDYLMWYWRPQHPAFLPASYTWVIMLIAYAVAITVTATLTRGPVRRFLASLLIVNTLSSVLVLVFAAKGVDHVGPGTYYVCYFYWSAPAIMLLVVAVAIAGALPSLVSIPAGAVLTAAACVAFALAPATNTLTTGRTDIDASLPHAVSVLAAQAQGKPVVIRLDHDGWIALTGLLVQAERTNVEACVANPAWAFMVSSEDICTPRQLADGKVFWIIPDVSMTPGMQPIAKLRLMDITAGPGPLPR
jgi:hypothetical protein